MLDRWAPSPGVTDPNVLQIPEAIFGSSGKLPSSMTASGRTQAAFGGSALAGTGMQFLGSTYGVVKNAMTLAGGEAGPRERKAAKVDLAESSVNAVSSGSSVAQSGINLAGSAAPHAATVAGGVLGGASGIGGTAIGTWWLAKHGRRAASAAGRWNALRKLDRPQPAAPIDEEEAAHRPLLGAPLSEQEQSFVQYARRKNRNQAWRAGLGALSGGLGAAAGAAGIAALLGASAATPVGWGLAAAGAGVGLGLGLWKLAQWGRRKYQTAQLGGRGKWDSFKSIFTTGKTQLQNEAMANGMRADQNPFGQAEHHASWLADRLEHEGDHRSETTTQLLRALDLEKHDATLRGADRNEKLKLIRHRLRSSG